ncbi:MAG: ABC transporter permease [Clostridia bacterium]|nr:ABC transporter permease [Clostridia bacterium]
MKRKWYATPYLVWLILFSIVPLVFVGYFAFTTKSGEWTVANFQKILQPMYMSVLGQSIVIALECTAVCLLVGYPTAYFLSSKDLSASQALVVLILVPMWMNFLLRTYAMMSLLETNGVINTALEAIGLPKLQLIGTKPAVVMGMVYNYLPFMILPIYTVLKKIDDGVLEAARDLGANAWQTFFRVTLPLSIPGVISGLTMVFLPSVTTFAITTMLGSGKVYLVGDMIEDFFINMNNKNVGSAISLILMVLIFISIGMLRKADPDGEGGGLM